MTDVIEGADTAYQYDWEFHGATGMVAAQIETHDMAEAAARLVAVAAQVRESVHDTAVLVLDGRLRLSSASPVVTGHDPSQLRVRKQCAAPGCRAGVTFALFGSAKGQWPIRYRGICEAGHVNLLTPQSGDQWIGQSD